MSRNLTIDEDKLIPIYLKKPARTHQRSTFSAAEDAKLTKLVEIHGENWSKIAKSMLHRNKRQCKERWEFYLSPTINNDPWSKEDDELLLSLTELYGTKWSLLCKRFEHRTPVNVKNRYMVLMRKQKNCKNKAEKAPDNKDTGIDNSLRLEEDMYVTELDAINLDDILNDEDILQFINL